MNYCKQYKYIFTIIKRKVHINSRANLANLKKIIQITYKSDKLSKVHSNYHQDQFSTSEKISYKLLSQPIW